MIDQCEVANKISTCQIALLKCCAACFIYLVSVTGWPIKRHPLELFVVSLPNLHPC